MPELNFCPFCDTPAHKIIGYKENHYFCRTCNAFFQLQEEEMACPKCKSKKIEDSDFPTPTGELVFQCQRCKKLFPLSEFLSTQQAKKK
ncbi:hypothetical protein HYW21_04845 [Candidatus Woesearchaeota archaeon]|nr:hypothetical protein [Candidatus Woesearchaeota archaeon]